MEFGQLLCETMVLWGKNHVKLLEGSEHLSIFLKMMMAFLQHSNANVALLTIDFWMFLVRESLLGDTSDPVEKRRLLRIPDGFVGALLDVIVSKMQKPVLDTLDDYPAEYYESVKDFHEKTAALRQRLVDISRSLAKSAPEEVFRACLGNLEKMFVHIQQNPSHNGIEIPLEAAVHLLFVASGATSAEAVGRSPALEALLAKLLNFPLAVMANRPVVIMQFVKCLESIGGHSHRIVPAVQCLLTILRSDAGQLSVPEEKHAARQQAATTVLALASRGGVQPRPLPARLLAHGADPGDVESEAIRAGRGTPCTRPSSLSRRALVWTAAEDPGVAVVETCQHFKRSGREDPDGRRGLPQGDWGEAVRLPGERPFV